MNVRIMNVRIMNARIVNVRIRARSAVTRSWFQVASVRAGGFAAMGTRRLLPA